MAWNRTPATTVIVGSTRAAPPRGPGGVYWSTRARKRNHHAKLVSPNVAKRRQAGTSWNPSRPSSAYSSQNALQARAVPSPRKAHPARWSGARPVTTTPTSQQAIIATTTGRADGPPHRAGPPAREASGTNVPTSSAGISSQVTPRARRRLAGCMRPWWQQDAPAYSGSALIPRPVTARSHPTGPNADAGGRDPETTEGAHHVRRPSTPDISSHRPEPGRGEGRRRRLCPAGRVAVHDRGRHQRPARALRRRAASLVAGLGQPHVRRRLGHGGTRGGRNDSHRPEPSPSPGR